MNNVVIERLLFSGFRKKETRAGRLIGMMTGGKLLLNTAETC